METTGAFTPLFLPKGMGGKWMPPVRSVTWGVFLSFVPSTGTNRVHRRPLDGSPAFSGCVQPALQVLGDQMSFIVLRQVVTSNEALLALGALETLVTCSKGGNEWHLSTQ